MSFQYIRSALGNGIDLAIAWCAHASATSAALPLNDTLSRNFSSILMAAYRWLSDNYEEGDRIFLFGLYCRRYQRIATHIADDG
jgi:uncharacterized protein (DUF2235 family)